MLREYDRSKFLVQRRKTDNLIFNRNPSVTFEISCTDQGSVQYVGRPTQYKERMR